MKPISLCLIQMGKKGLELVKAHPDVVPESTLNQIVLKSMPMSSKEGDFSSSTADKCVFESYIFSVPGAERNNIATLVAVFEGSDYKREDIRRFFSFTVTELEKNQMVNIEMITKILPHLYEGLSKEKVKIKISSVVTLEFDFTSEKKSEEDPGKEFAASMQDDLWK